MDIRFYAGAGGTGDLVAIGQATVTIQPNGSGIGNITVTNTVTSAAVDPGQSVQETETQQLTFTARDSQGAIVAVSPGSGTWGQINGASAMSLSQDGIATGLQVGSSDVTVTVDGVASPAVAVTVLIDTTPVTYNLHWGARSRHGGPSSALSSILTITGGNPDGQDFVTQVNRHADPAGYDETYVTANECKVGTFQVTIRFYALPNGAGDMVASGQATVTIQPDGTGIGDVTIMNTITSVVVDPGQSLAVSEVKQLTFTARDINGAIVAVTPGSAFWSQIDGSAFMSLTQDGIATGLQPGSSNVFLTLDTLFGQSAAVAVTP